VNIFLKGANQEKATKFKSMIKRSGYSKIFIGSLLQSKKHSTANASQLLPHVMSLKTATRGELGDPNLNSNGDLEISGLYNNPQKTSSQ
jgi:hypothetical protein